MGEPPIAIWIVVFLVAVIVGRWWFSIVAGVVVFLVIAVATDPDAGSIEVGFLVGAAVFLTTLCAIALRWLSVAIAKGVLEGRRKRRHPVGSTSDPGDDPPAWEGSGGTAENSEVK